MIKVSLSPRRINIFAIVISIAIVGRSGETNPDLTRYLDRAKIKNQTAVYITEIDGTKVYEHNQAKAMIPASLTKLAVLGAVYKNIPLDTKWTSSLYLQKKPTDGTANALCFKGGGDPAFVSESMWNLVNHFSRENLRELKGDIIVDTTLFDSEKYDSGRQDTRVARAYDAPVSAASFNWNAVNIYVRPNGKGKNASIFMDPENEYFSIINDVKGVAGSLNNLKRGLKLDRISVGPNGEKIKLSGKIGVKNDEAVVYRSVEQPALWLGYNLKAFLKQRGIDHKGKVKLGSCEKYPYLAASTESKDLQLVLRDMMKFSNNFVTEILAKHLARRISPVGNMKDGKKVIGTYLKSIGVDSFKIESVSGLSYDNRVSAEDLNKILLDLYKNNFRKYEALETFPIAGIDGTLKSRLKGNLNIKAKTGLLSTVVGLAGYFQDKSNKIYSFVMIYNGKDIYKAKQTFDDILVDLVK